MNEGKGRALRILILYSNTGGGHRASAEALRQEFLRRNPHHTIVLEDVLMQRTFWPLTESDRFYFWAVSKAPWFWKALYRSVARREVYTTLNRTLGPIVGPRVRHVYDITRPDLVIAAHPLLNHLPRRVLRRWERENGRPPVPFATVITDLTTFHPAWVDPEVDLITVATEEAYAGVLRLGAPPERVRILGLPVREVFRDVPRDKGAVRQMLGLEKARPVVLLMSGGQGMGPVEAIAAAIAEGVKGAQLVIVCGRNEALRERLCKRSWPIPTRVLGFVEDVHLWMAASDVLVTKAGPGTIAEALICGLPMILYGHIPGQEEGNVTFVTRRQIGAYVTKPKEIARTLERWLSQPEAHLQPMQSRARALAHPDATVAIVDALLSLVERFQQRAEKSSLARSEEKHRLPRLRFPWSD